jgi:hypothetical protein
MSITTKTITKKQKTILIVVTKSFIIRNILRSGVLEHLKKSGARIVICLYDFRKQGLPEYLRKEFEDDQVVIEAITPFKKTKFHRLFHLLTFLLVYSKNNRRIRYIKYNKNPLGLFLEYLIFGLLSKVGFLKTVVRWIEKKMLPERVYGVYFDKYDPDVVFSTSIISSADAAFMKEAARRGIKTVSMPRGWDNVTTKFYWVIPDLFLVENEIMKRNAVKCQNMKPERIKVCGFPQFDWYRKPEILMDRETYFKLRGLDPNRKLILWGSTGAWTPEDRNACEPLIEAVNKKGVLVKPVSILIRSHFTNARGRIFDYLRGTPNVMVDDNFTFSDFFRDGCDPSVEEIKLFINTIYHADLVVTLCSTLSLDAFCFDKPVINTAFGGFYDKDGRDVTAVLYTHDHYQPLLEIGAIDLVSTEKELIDSVNRYLEHPEYKREERKKALELLCYKVDGKSSERIAREILLSMA